MDICISSKDLILSSDNLILLVDEMDAEETIGKTLSQDKIILNAALMSKWLDIVKEPFPPGKGLLTIFPIGRYIAVVARKSIKEVANMSFFDFNLPFETLKLVFPSNTVTQMIKVQSAWNNYFSNDLDRVKLSRTLTPFN